MVIHVVAVGRVKHAALREACRDYAARVSRYLRLEIREVREAGRKRVAAGDLLNAIPEKARVVALTRKGRWYSSQEFARLLSGWQRQARDIAIVIGGAHGLDQEVISRSEDQLSLSPMTLPHELARLVLLEQVYRACTILRGEPYHKGK